MKQLCTILLAAALYFGTTPTASAQSLAPGTYGYTGLASNGQAYTITAVITETGISFQEAVVADVLCSATLTLESIDPTNQIFTYKTATPGDCTLGMPYIFTMTPVTTTLEFRKSEGVTYTLNLQ